MLPKIGSSLYHLLLRLAAVLGHPKAKKWVAGRKALLQQVKAIQKARKVGQPLLWMHAASLGEFEQGAPVFEALKNVYPKAYFLLTFFSPSGFEAKKQYALADAVLYLPPDNKRSSQDWIKAIQPSLAIFIKYEFWPYHLDALQKQRVPTVLIAAAFRSSQPFFQWYGSSWRKMLHQFDRIIVQTNDDAALLAQIGLTSNVAGDPRADRVLQVADQSFTDQVLMTFSNDHKVLFAGSVWPQDVHLLFELLATLPNDWKLIMAPHQLKERQITEWTDQFKAIRYTHASKTNTSTLAQTSVLILDTIGMLSKSYRYANLAYVGGGFGSGIHNTLEPMAYELPVLFGPKFQKFSEAVITVKSGGSFVVKNSRDLIFIFKHLSNLRNYEQARKQIKAYTLMARGATQRTLAALPDIPKLGTTK